MIPSTLYSVAGFSTFRKERKSGGGVLAFINNNLCSRQRNDLENEDLEILWFEVCPFKSKRSRIIIGSIYRPLSYLKDDDAKLEANIEKVHLFNKETIILSDINIDFHHKRNYDKHRLLKGVRSMNFKQLTTEVTRPSSGTCLDHVYPNLPRRIVAVETRDIGLSDHLPVFCVRKYRNEVFHSKYHKNIRIKYRKMKKFNEEYSSSLIRLRMLLGTTPVLSLMILTMLWPLGNVFTMML